NGLTVGTGTHSDKDVKLGGDLIENTVINQDNFSLEIATNEEDLIISGLDKSEVQATVNGATTTGITQHLLAVDENNNVKALKAAMPKFFYMPSIIVPTSEEQLNNPASGQVTGDAFDDNTLQGTINLYGRYEAQFGTPMVSNGGSTTTLPVLPATELDYHITWYDTNVFTLVSVSDSGVLTYTVDGNADITVGSFMNIVFSVKED